MDEFLAHVWGDLRTTGGFVLMEIILQSFEDLGLAVAVDPRCTLVELTSENLDGYQGNVSGFWRNNSSFTFRDRP